MSDDYSRIVPRLSFKSLDEIRKYLHAINNDDPRARDSTVLPSNRPPAVKEQIGKQNHSHIHAKLKDLGEIEFDKVRKEWRITKQRTLLQLLTFYVSIVLPPGHRPKRQAGSTRRSSKRQKKLPPSPPLDSDDDGGGGGVLPDYDDSDGEDDDEEEHADSSYEPADRSGPEPNVRRSAPVPAPAATVPVRRPALYDDDDRNGAEEEAVTDDEEIKRTFKRCYALLLNRENLIAQVREDLAARERRLIENESRHTAQLKGREERIAAEAERLAAEAVARNRQLEERAKRLAEREQQFEREHTAAQEALSSMTAVDLLARLLNNNGNKH